jgi:hypothetical protein
MHACLPKLLRTATLMAAVLMAWSAKAATLFTNSSFETGLWGGNQSFVNPNDATSLFNSTTTIDGWATSIGSTWVQEPTHTTDGNRMVWLGPPSVGSADCVNQKLSVSSTGDPAMQLIAGNDYSLSVDYAFYDPSDPTASNSNLSRFIVYYLLGTNSVGDIPFTQTTLYTNADVVSPWNDGFGGSGLIWKQATITFALPDITGYDYMKFFISAPKSTAGATSRGVLVDNASLAVVPEPGSLLLCAPALLMLARRQRRSR